MALSRRDFLRSSAGLAASSLALSCASLRRPLAAGSHAAPPFLHGVASGDPLADRVVLWTRLTPPPGSDASVPLRWEVARDAQMREIVAKGRTRANAERDYTVKLDAAGLEAGRTYHYRFDALGEASPVGRTRTLPTSGPLRARFGVVSCSNRPQGHFGAYASLAQESDLDAVLHLGDYIYEYGRDGYGGDAGLGRDVEPAHEILTLADYRARYAQYRADPELQAVHRQHPFIAVWDDHEIANNTWREGAENHQPRSEGDFAARRAAAVRAYFEWMPIRPQAEPGRIFRSFRYADLVDLVMLDTRLWGRDQQAKDGDRKTIEDPSRTLLGADQEAWLGDQLRRSQRDGTKWRLLGQQVMLADCKPPGRRLNPDSWDGYRASRTRLLDQLGPGRIPDVVTLTGDYHSSWAMEVAPDPWDERHFRPGTGQGAVAVEFVTPAISSRPLGATPGVPDRYGDLALDEPHVRWLDIQHNGHLLLDVSPERMEATWQLQRDVTRPGAGAFRAARFATERGAYRLEQRA